jgi:C-terminal processing protease CtpA/Prc
LFISNNLPASLVCKLAFIRDKHKAIREHYYVRFDNEVGNPIFKNESAYTSLLYPDAGIRLMTLYRYWNMIQYFFPDRHLIQEDWNTVLAKFIPKFIHAGNKAEYTLACMELIGSIHDTHANIWGKNPLLDSIKGTMMTPFQAKFVENKLVVTGYYNDDKDTKHKVKVGDVIESIDSFKTEELVKKYLPYSPASNYETQLRVLSSITGFLLRSNNSTIALSIKRGKEHKNVLVRKIPVSSVNKMLDFMQYPNQNSHRVLEKGIGYIYPAKLTDKSLFKIKKELANTKAIIIDMRCYPSSFMPFAFGEWLKDKSSSFVRFSATNMTTPGTFIYTAVLNNGFENENYYKGKVVILVNEMTQSQAEYTALALRTAPKAIVMGSITAGADGNVSEIILPGGISTMISGIGVYYPDGTETQRVGVKIDIPIQPTINGIRMGKDEVLERAIKYIKDGR